MFSQPFQKISGAIRQWFESIWVPAEPVLIPVKIQHDELSHRQVHIKRKWRV